ncbi:hypothetical protein BSY18_4158 (plasmid) [Blastomonas sp. RAC04]|nr:hypothetical protein BSY18_4158 [Blastomonas sp. RAC04]
MKLGIACPKLDANMLGSKRTCVFDDDLDRVCRKLSCYPHMKCGDVTLPHFLLVEIIFFIVVGVDVDTRRVEASGRLARILGQDHLRNSIHQVGGYGLNAMSLERLGVDGADRDAEFRFGSLQ